MENISYTYKVRRVDNRNFHGWIVSECSEYLEEDIFSSSSLDDVKTFMRDMGAREEV